MTDLIQARNYTRADRADARAICIHTMESPEKPGTARGVAKWFAGTLAPQASAHYCIDNLEVVQCVKETDVAWAAPGLNASGIHLEHAGFARQTLTEWSDEYSMAMLRLSARLSAEIARRYGIPVVKLTVEQVADGHTRGFCGHVDVTNAFHKSTHTDPGPSFPWAEYLGMVQDEIDGLTPTDPAPPPDPEGHPI